MPKKNEEKKAILETYTKEYSAEYQAQALIDLAKKLKSKIVNLKDIKKVEYENIPNLCDKFNIKKNLINPVYLS